MSAPSGEDKCEPNLTPLLDLVLQLVMFFMLTANFDKLDKNKDVILPKASQLVPPDRDVLVQLQVEMASPPPEDKKAVRGKWTLSSGSGPEELQGPTDLFQKLQIKAQLYGIGKHAEALPEAEKKKPKPKVAVILRIDRNVPFKQIHEVMIEINKAGFEDVQIRANKE